MKKVLSFILACVVAISLCTCGGSSGSEQTKYVEEDVKNTPNYKFGDSFKVLNVIDVSGEIRYLNPISKDGYFDVGIKNNNEQYYDLKGNIGYNKVTFNGYERQKDEKTRKYILVDSYGKNVLNEEFNVLAGATNDYLYATKDDIFYIFDKNLNIIFRYKNNKIKGIDVGKYHGYNSTPSLKNGLVNINNEKNLWGYVDLNGKTVIDFKYYDAGPFSNNGYASVVGKNKQGEYKFGLINKKGKSVIDYQYDTNLYFNNGISKANKDGVGYYININNEQVLNGLLFEETAGFSEGLAGVKKNGKWGFIDINGSEVFPCMFDYIRGFSDGIALGAYKNHVVVLTYLDTLPAGFTDADVNNSYQKLSQIDGGSSYWTDLRRKLANKYNYENWSNKDYEDDFNYTLTYKEVQPNTWYVTDAGVWYYFENDRTTRKTGWYNEPKDGQTYYLNPTNGVMATGWTEIDGGMYYFHEVHSSTPNWYYIPESDSWESHGKNIKSYGALYKDETTPDGNRVDSNGRMIK